ncbi:MAG: SMP-30/gluconolactonase/LRE family protein [Bacteroidetes bacterium]|nr:MAG: SMP-30/gluconolactonase/LRE family protein [Bacteroidota bacterium]
MKRFFSILIALLMVLVLYLLLWPVDIDPQSWTPPEAPALEGVYAPNDYLARMELYSTLPHGEGPEAIALDSLGNLYTGLLNGLILRYPADFSEPQLFARTGGRPLGMKFDPTGRLVVADADKGLLAVDSSGHIDVLATEAAGRAFGFTDDLDIGQDGTIYFTDASWKFSVHEWRKDIIEHAPNGRLLAYDPHSGSCRLLLDSLYFANGVALSPEEDFLLVNETSKYRIRRYWLKGPKAGSAEVWIDNLPGFPDNITSNGQGTYWLALANVRNEALDKLLPHPFLRKMVMRLPEFMQPQQQRHSFALGLDANARVVHNLQDPKGRLSPVTSVLEWEGKLYLGSLSDPAFGIVPRP